MLGRMFTVGGFTLLSRVTGFVRDIVLAAILGAGPMADAFFIAFRLPNHFRAIFAEGAFNAAFVPAYARIITSGGKEAAGLFADRVFAMLLASQIVLLVVAVAFMPGVVMLLAPGLADDPVRFPLAIELTRITFPYLLMITLVTLYGGILNAVNRFATPAAAPILLNLAMTATLLATPFFPNAAYASAWGVLISGVLQLLLVGADAWRAGLLPRPLWPRWDDDIKRFFRALGPATLGSAGLQIALFADTIIASFLAAGAVSALYYADRLAQLPIGVIGIAAGTVLLPEMSRRLAAGDHEGAQRSQNRAVELILLLSIPCLAAFMIVPDLLMRVLFMRGAFTAADAEAAGLTLAAYSLGLFPFVLIRSAVAPFLARGDTATPVKASLTGVAVNVVCKTVLMGWLAQIGLALATAIGAWVNFLLVIYFARRAGLVSFDKSLLRSLARLAIAGVSLAIVLWIADIVTERMSANRPTLRDEITFAVLIVAGGLVYGGLVLAFFGREWAGYLRRRSPPKPPAV